MKSILTLIIATLLSTSSFADRRPTRLTISIPENSDIEIVIDGRRFSNNDRTVNISNIDPGVHTLRVYRNRDNGRNRNRRKDADQLLHSTSIRIKPSYHVDVVINRFGKAFVDEQRMDRRYDDWYSDREDRYDGNGNWDEPYGESVMQPREFSMFLATLRREPFEDMRLNTARQEIARSAVNTDQVIQLLTLFAFENNKLEFAKFAYRYTVDRRDYFRVVNNFSFNRSKEELERYIRDAR